MTFYSADIELGNGVKQTFGLTFDYVDRNSVYVYLIENVDGSFAELTAIAAGDPAPGQYIWDSDTQVRLGDTPSANQSVKIQRRTLLSRQEVQWQDASYIIADDLNTSEKQSLYLDQELHDWLGEITGGGAGPGDFVDLTNLGDVTIANPEDNDVLSYNDTTDQWENTPSRTTADQIAGTPPWDDTAFATAGAIAERHDNVVSPTLPTSVSNQDGRFWYQNDATKTLWVWDKDSWDSIVVGTANTPTVYPQVIYVDSTNGKDENDGHQVTKAKETIKAAVEQANNDPSFGNGTYILCAAGVYMEEAPITITAQNLSIVGQSIRSVYVHPTSATETETLLLCDSGTYVNNITFAGIKASGPRGGAGSVDPDPVYGLPSVQGWVAAFRPGAIIYKSPYIQNCTNFADSSIDNDNFDPNNLRAGDITSSPTGGGILIDGETVDSASPLRSFVVDAFTQITLDGPGVLAKRGGYAQLVSFFGTFCHYHAKCLSGAQINLTNSTTDFGRYGLIADGYSEVNIFSAAVTGLFAQGSQFIEVNSFTRGTGWEPPRAMVPADHMVVEIGGVVYPILKSTPLDPADLSLGYSVQIFSPGAGQTDSTLSQVFKNQGLIETVDYPSTVKFYLQSYISTSGHTFEFAGSGCDYRSHPDFSGVANEANQVIEIGGAAPAVGPNPDRMRYLNGGRVWQSSTNEQGKFTVGETFNVNQKTGEIYILPDAVIQPDFEVRKDIDLRGFKIVQDPNTAGANAPLQLQPAGDGDIVLGTTEVDSDGNRINPAAIRAPILEAQTDGRDYPVVTQEDLGYDPDEVPVAGLLGKLAFSDSAPAVSSTQSPPLSNELTFTVSGTTLTISYQPTGGGAVQTTTLTLS